MPQHLRDHPHLPMLELEWCLSVFVTAKISFNMLATTGEKRGLMDFSRQSLYLWRKGRNPHATAMDQVNVLAYKALACLRDGTMPLKGKPHIDTVRAKLDAIDLSTRTVELLPKRWRDALEAGVAA